MTLTMAIIKSPELKTFCWEHKSVTSVMKGKWLYSDSETRHSRIILELCVTHWPGTIFFLTIRSVEKLYCSVLTGITWGVTTSPGPVRWMDGLAMCQNVIVSPRRAAVLVMTLNFKAALHFWDVHITQAISCYINQTSCQRCLCDVWHLKPILASNHFFLELLA